MVVADCTGVFKTFNGFYTHDMSKQAKRLLTASFYPNLKHMTKSKFCSIKKQTGLTDGRALLVCLNEPSCITLPKAVKPFWDK